MKKNRNWPANVEESNGRIIYRPVFKGEPPKGYDKDSKNRLRPPVKLGRSGDDDTIILAKYLKVVEELKSPANNRVNSLSWIFDLYSRSAKFAKLAQTTQSGYLIHIKVFLDYDLHIGNRKAKLGEIKASQVTLPMMNTIKNKMCQQSKDKGEDGTSYVNGHIRAVRAMMSWAINNIDHLGIHHNPLQGITLDTENKRKRYVSDEEYMVQYMFAVNRSPEYLPLVFEHAYMLACRSIEVCNLTLENIQPEGYKVERAKGSKDNLITWTPRLEAARDAAIMYRDKVGTNGNFLIPSLSGNKLTKNTIQSAMQSLKKMLHAAGLDAISWDLHDLKRKGISEADDGKIGGHKSEHIREQYMVKLEHFKPPA